MQKPRVSEPTGDTKPAPRRRRWLKRIARIGFVGIVLVGVAQLGERELDRIQGERDLSRALASAEQADPDWTWERLNAARKRPPAGQNSAEVIPQVKKLIPPEFGKHLHVKGEWIPRVAKAPPNVRYDSTVLVELRRDIAACPEATRLARSLKEYPFGYREYALTPDVIYTMFEETQWTRNAADLLRWDAVVAAEDGDPQRASDDLLAMVGVGRSIGDEPTYIAQLIRGGVRIFTVRVAERTIAQSAVLPNLAQLQTVLATEAEEPILWYALRGERAQAHQLFENLRAGKTDIFALTGSEPDAWTRYSWQFKLRGDRAADHALAIRYFTRYIEAARLPLEKQAEEIERLPVVQRDPSRLVSNLVVTKPKSFLGHVRGAALVRCAVAGIACERFRRDRGAWPDTLAALVPTYLAAVPLDPLTGEVLRYTKSESGVIVFSAGHTLEDGGTHEDMDPPGSGRIRFRLWNPEHRRQPPPPDLPAPEQEP